MTVARGWSNLYTYGNALWDNKVELRMPIVKEAILLVGFFDMAALWDAPKDISFQADPTGLLPFLFSFGFGVRFTIPQFPIRLYFSKGFRISNGQVVWKDPEQLPAIGLSFVISLGGDVF
jgi:outer membrane protein insertion porin family